MSIMQPVIRADGQIPADATWQEAMQAYLAAKRAEEDFDRTTYDPAQAAWEAAEKAFDRAWPHTMHDVGDHRFSTKDHFRAGMERPEGTSRGSAQRQAQLAAYLRAYDERWDARAALPENLAFDAAGRISDELINTRCVAEEELVQTPAPGLSAAAWKMRFAVERWEGDIPKLWAEAVSADLTRLTGGEA